MLCQFLHYIPMTKNDLFLKDRQLAGNRFKYLEFRKPFPGQFGI